jgi:hypothetical protein
LVQKKLVDSDGKDAYFCTFCEDEFFVTLREWRKHCKTHAAEKAKEKKRRENYKKWKAGGFE